MILVPYTIVALAKTNEEGTSGSNIVAGAVVQITDLSGVVTMYDDSAGTNGATTKVTDSDGQVVVYIEAGEYNLFVNGKESKFILSVAEEVDPDVVTKSVDLVADYGAVGDAIYQYEVDGTVTIISGTDDTQALLDAMADFAVGNISALTVPAGKYWIDSSQIDCPTGTTVIGSGSNSTEFIMSTTTPNLNLFVGFYGGARVENLQFSGFKVIGSKTDDNTIGGTGIFTFGTDGVVIDDVHSEGCKGLAWLGNDNVDGLRLYGTRNAIVTRCKVDDCKLFSVYIRGNENPNVAALPENDTSNITVDGLTIRGSNVGFVIAEGLPFDIRLSNYDCQDTDNLLQIESCHDVYIDQFHISGATSQWNALTPAPFKLQWQIAGSSNIHFTNGYIDSELQSFAFPLNNRPCKNITFESITTGSVTRFTTLSVQDGVDTNKNMFANWSFSKVYLPRDGNTFFQTPAIVGGGAPRPVAYWRDWSWSDCMWENDSTTSPISAEACVGSLVFDDKCAFNGKPPRAIYGQKVTFDATVRANGILGTSVQFNAVDDIDPLDQAVLRVGGNFQIEGEVKDVGFDVVHDNGTYDSRNQSPQCRTSDAQEFNDSGSSFYRFTGSTGIISDGVGTYKSLVTGSLPTIAGLNTFITTYTGTVTALNIVNGADATTNESLVIVKKRNAATSWIWNDTLRGAGENINSNNSGAEYTAPTLTSFNADGFSLGTNGDVNTNTSPYVSYQMLAAEGFLDIISDVGTEVAKTIAHSLGTDVGFILSKNRDAADGWVGYYHTFDIAAGKYISLDNNGIVTDSTVWNSTAATDTEFSVGTNHTVNALDEKYIHYVFADSVCHSYSGNGLTTNIVEIGYKSKMIIIKRASAGTTGDWVVYDNERDAGDFDTKLSLNTTAEEAAATAIELTDTGIILKSNDPNFNAAGSSYMLIAIPEI